MKKHLIARLVYGLIALPAQAKTVTDYRFEKYPAKVYTGKNPLKLGDWTMFKTHLRQTHTDTDWFCWQLHGGAVGQAVLVVR